MNGLRVLRVMPMVDKPFDEGFAAEEEHEDQPTTVVGKAAAALGLPPTATLEEVLTEIARRKEEEMRRNPAKAVVNAAKRALGLPASSGAEGVLLGIDTIKKTEEAMREAQEALAEGELERVFSDAIFEKKFDPDNPASAAELAHMRAFAEQSPANLESVKTLIGMRAARINWPLETKTFYGGRDFTPREQAIQRAVRAFRNDAMAQKLTTCAAYVNDKLRAAQDFVLLTNVEAEKLNREVAGL